MPCILFGEAFAGKDMPEMTSAVAADDLCPSTISIGMLRYCTGDFIIKAGPSAAGSKFVFGFIEWLITLPAYIGTGKFIVVVFSGKRPFGSFVEDDVFFFFSERVVGHGIDFFSSLIGIWQNKRNLKNPSFAFPIMLWNNGTR